MMNNAEKRAESFDFNKTSKVLQKAKLFTFIRTVTISFVVFVLLSGALVVLNSIMLGRIATKELISEHLFDTVARPNIYQGQYQVTHGFLAGEIAYVTYRIVGTRPVYNGSYRIDFSLIPLTFGIYGTGRGQLNRIEVAGGYHYFNRAGQREMIFFHPAIQYQTYPNDLDSLEAIGPDKYLEMALSFDRDYSFKEVQAMLPGEVKIAWYWVDTYNQDNLAGMKGRYLARIGPDGQPTGEKEFFPPEYMHANRIYGMRGLSSEGEIIDDPRPNFVEAIKTGMKREGRYQSQFQRLFSALSNDKGEIAVADLRIIGVVVTGDTASLSQLQGKDYLKAASLGIVADKF